LPDARSAVERPDAAVDAAIGRLDAAAELPYQILQTEGLGKGGVARIVTRLSTLHVFEVGPYRCFSFAPGGAKQSCVHRKRPYEVAFEYLRMMFAFSAGGSAAGLTAR
jgi:hypothetical protein